MREHPELGYRLLEGLGVSPVDRWIRHHHEWWDGSGYPLGLAGDEIPLGSRIILVADAFDAMTSDRVLPGGGHGRGGLRRAPAALLDAVRRARRRGARGVPGLRELASRRAGERGRLMVLLLAVGLGIVAGWALGGRLSRLADLPPPRDLALLRGDRPADRRLPLADPAVERGRPAGDRPVARLLRLPRRRGGVQPAREGRRRRRAGHGVEPDRDRSRTAATCPASPRRCGPPATPTPGCTTTVVASHPHLAWLVDRWAVPHWIPGGNVYSVGDVLIAVGAVVMVSAAMGGRLPFVGRLRRQQPLETGLAGGPTSTP